MGLKLSTDIADENLKGGLKMRIVIGNVNKSSENPQAQQSPDQTGRNVQPRDRRKRRRDRRKSVRDGVIVRLSYKRDRRSGRDRRKA